MAAPPRRQRRQWRPAGDAAGDAADADAVRQRVADLAGAGERAAEALRDAGADAADRLGAAGRTPLAAVAAPPRAARDPLRGAGIEPQQPARRRGHAGADAADGLDAAGGERASDAAGDAADADAVRQRVADAVDRGARAAR
ncbi:MAG: hypothetical protein H6708_33780 [Kofleriaceae bacterium]|nr:hypothetical protein [Kofleriaceae bacterium]